MTLPRANSRILTSLGGPLRPRAWSIWILTWRISPGKPMHPRAHSMTFSWKNLYRHLALGPEFSSDVAGDGPAAKRVPKIRKADALIHRIRRKLRVPHPTPSPALATETDAASPSTNLVPETTSATPSSPLVSETPPESRSSTPAPRSYADEVIARPSADTRLIDMHPGQYVYLQEAMETLRFIPERVLKPFRGAYNQLMRSIISNPPDLLRWKKFILLPMVLLSHQGTNTDQASKQY